MSLAGQCAAPSPTQATYRSASHQDHAPLDRLERLRSTHPDRRFLRHFKMLDRVTSKLKGKKPTNGTSPSEVERNEPPSYETDARHDNNPPAYSDHDCPGDESEAASDKKAPFVDVTSPPEERSPYRSPSMIEARSPENKGKRIDIAQRWGVTPSGPYESRTPADVPKDHPVHDIPPEKQEKMRKKGINPVLRAEMDEKCTKGKGFWAKVAGAPGDGAWMGVN